MAAFNFADSYRAAGLNPGPEILRLRQGPFDALRKGMDPTAATNLTRLYFGLDVPGGTDWFRDAFGETDSSFSMYDNEREAAVLAAGLLEAGLDDGKSYAGLAPLTAAAAGARTPLVRPELLELAKTALISDAIKGRQRSSANPGLLKLPGKSKAPAEITTLLTSPDWNKLGTILNQMVSESNEWTKNLTNQVFGVVKPLVEQVAELREEVDMLWWHVGGWSRVLEKPFSELKPALAAVMAGLDLADLSRTPIGIAAAPAILQRTVTSANRKKTTSVTISDAVDAMTADELEKLEIEEALDGVPEICPVLTAFAKASEIGAGTAWHASFKKATRLEPALAFSPVGLATQVYRERLLLSDLS
ncbi:GTPase-associated system all-helical protein GASH [Methylobacterium iners]|uniref:GTPase-associated system helical domain-containing protein n=1 Tax=Methylobacterium iners TaxID=418707 RepID=A0ABQ4S3I6_9HYPH|nr:GTPase-associated system all-helical protein GASH [Methylobacterium iners]GJD97659.1 hypothetical protein OCOJLMKI_4892 [Methylobacterium iners]